MRSTTITTVLVTILLGAADAQAIDACKVKVDKRTGALVVSASGVTGTLLWGAAEAAETETFYDAATCIADGKASKCAIADPATLAAKTPPPGCTLYLHDDSGPCSVWIAGCTPGTRSAPTAVCGDGQAASGESCDGPDLNGKTCRSEGFLYGDLACADCALETTGCTDSRYRDNGNGTVTDRQTNLMWEQKTAGTGGGASECPGPCANPHSASNMYVLSTVSGSALADGSAYLHFLAVLNGPNAFAGHDDWRLPTITEMQSLIDLSATGCGAGSDCVDPVFGPAGLYGWYWSSLPVSGTTTRAWMVDVRTPGTQVSNRNGPYHVRAVRNAD